MIFFKYTKKEEANVSPEKAKTKLLTAQKWNIYKYTIGTPNTPTRSISQLASEKNNGQYYTDFSYAYVIFRSDGTYISLDVDKKNKQQLYLEIGK